MNVNFYMIAYGKKSQFHAELFARTLELYGKLPNYELTIAIDKLINPYLKRFKLVKNNDSSWYDTIAQVPSSSSDVTILTDADIIINEDLSEIVEICYKSQSVCGVIAYKTPFFDETVNWKSLFEFCNIKLPKQKYKHPLEEGFCPYYINFGFVAVPTKMVKSLAEYIPQFFKKTEELLPGHFHRPQFALCLTLEYLNLPRRILPLRYNYPDMIKNGFDFEDELKEAKVLHLLHSKSHLSSWSEVSKFLTIKNTSPVQELINRHLSHMLKQRKMII
jgi:lipopolysaccharide biosynthesis glycosyltransferase